MQQVEISSGNCSQVMDDDLALPNVKSKDKIASLQVQNQNVIEKDGNPTARFRSDNLVENGHQRDGGINDLSDTDERIMENLSDSFSGSYDYDSSELFDEDQCPYERYLGQVSLQDYFQIESVYGKWLIDVAAKCTRFD